MRPPFRSRSDLWQLLWPTLRRDRKRPRRRCQRRTAAAQQLEPREMLAASLEVFNGGTQLFSGGNVSLGNYAVGATAELTIGLANGGDETLEVDQPSVSMGFSAQGTFPIDIAPGDSSTLTVSMDTSSPASLSSELDIYSNDPNYMAPFAVYLSGTVTGTPSLSLYDGSRQLARGDDDSFGSVMVGDSDNRSFNISNPGSDVLNVNSLSLPNGFYTNTSFPLTVYPGQSAGFDVSLYTSGPGSFSGPMTLASDDPDGAFGVALDGTVNAAAAPALTLRDGSTTLSNFSGDSFGYVDAGTSASKTFSLSNSGTADLTVSSISLPGGFSLAPDTALPIAVAPGHSSTFSVAMDTASAASYSGPMEIDSNDSANSPLTVTLDGVVNPPALPNMQVAANRNTLSNNGAWSFGTVTVGDSASTDFQISNSGSGPLTISSISLPAGFSTSASLPITVSPNGAADVTVTMDTSAAATPSGVMVLRDNDGGDNNDPYNINVSGIVAASTAPNMRVSLGSTVLANGSALDFGTATAGAVDSQTLTISNQGNAALHVSSLTLPSGFTSDASLPLTIDAGQSASLTISLDTSSVMNAFGQLSLGDDDQNNNPYTLNVSGSVAPPAPVLTLFDGTTAVANGGGSDDFGGTLLAAPIDRTLTIDNAGSSAIALTPGSLELPTGFSLEGAFPTSVPAQGSATFIVRLDASQPGTDQGQAQFSDADPGGGTYQFWLNGMVTAPALNVMDQGMWLANGATDNFGETTEGQPIDRTITLMNQGDGPLSLTPTSLIVPAGFSLQGVFPSSIAAGTSAAFVVRLDAKQAGSFAGSLSFDDSDVNNSPFALTLTGQVDAPSGAIAVAENGSPVIDGQTRLEFGATDAGVPVAETLLVRNTGLAPLALDTQTLILPAGFDVTQIFDSSVAPGASTTLAIELNSAQGGDFGGLASFDTGDPDHPSFSFFVSGHVNPPEPLMQVLEGTTVLANGSSDDFGATSLGVAEEQTWSIENQGNASLELDTHSLWLPAGFSVVTPFAASVPPGAATTLVIRLDADAGGDFLGALGFSDNDVVDENYTVNLHGQVLASAMTVLNGSEPVANDDGTVDFAATPLGAPVTRTLSIQNNGAADLSLDPLSLSLPAGYSLVSGFASDVAPGASTSLTIQLGAVAVGQTNGQVVFRDGDPNNSPFSFAVTGIVTAPTLEVLDGATNLLSGMSDDFGSTTLGSPIERTLTIVNTGQAPLTLDAASLVIPSGFSLVTPFASTVAAGDSTTLVLQLNAGVADEENGLCTFVSNDPITPVYKLHLFGDVLAPALEVRQAGALVANGASVSLGTTSVGAPLDLTLVIANNGTGSLTLDPASLMLPTGFILVRSFDATVAPASGTTLVIALAATAAGSYSGTLSFHENDVAQDPFQLSLSGTVTAPAVSVLDGSTTIANQGVEDLGLTPVATGLQKVLTVQNDGTSPLTIDTANITLPAGFSLFSAPAGEIDAGASSPMVVELDATATGDYAGTLSLPTSDPLLPTYSFTLSGRVLLASATLAVKDGPTVVARGDTVSYPATQTGLPVSKTFVLENQGYPALSLDTSSIALPAGYSVVTPFASSIPGGGSTTLVARLDAAAAGSYPGALSFAYGTDPNNPTAYDSSYSVTVSGTVTDPAPAMSVLDGATTLVDGTSTVVFPATVVGSPTTETLVINNVGAGQLSLDPDSLVLPSGFSVLTPLAATVAPGASTSLVIQLDATAAGSPGGTLSFSDNLPDDSSFSVSLSGNVSAPTAGISVADVLDGGAAIANGGAEDFGATSVETPVYKLLAIENTGSGPLSLDASSLVLPAGFSVFAPFASSVAAGGETVLTIEMNADAAGAFSGALSFGYNDGTDQTYSFTLSGAVTAPAPAGIRLDNVELLNNIGPRSALAAADPTLTGIVDGTFNGGSVVVEIDSDGDGAPNGQSDAVTVARDSFTFDPRTVDPSLAGFVGPVDLKYRARIIDAAGGVSLGPWSDFSFNLVAPPSAAHVDDLALVNDTGASATDLLTYDPRVSGQVGGPFVGTTVDVQFEDNGGGAPMGAVTGLTVPGQSFVYNPAADDPTLVNLSGTVTLNYRTVERDAGGNVVQTGAWTPFALTLYSPTPRASVGNFHLLDDTGVSNSDLVTTDPRVAGTVTGTFTNEIVDVQFSNHGDGVIDGAVAVVDVGSDFDYDPRLSDPTLNSYSGVLPLKYRTVELDGQGGEITGAWASFSLTLQTGTSAAVIDDLRLVNISGAAGPPATTDDATVAGTVVGAQPGGTAQVQFDYNGDGTSDEATSALSDGTFSDTLPGLPYGSVALSARAVEFDSADGIELYGAWSSVDFSFVPAPPANLGSLALANVTDLASGGTSDPSVKGTVPVASQDLAALTEIQFDTDGDGQADATTLADMQGNFSFTPVGLAYGVVTIAARSVAQGAGPLAYSPWFSLTFNYEAPPVQAPLVKDFRLANSGASTTVTTDPTVTGTVSGPLSVVSGDSSVVSGPLSVANAMPQSAAFLKVELDYDGDGVPDASTTTGPGGTFTFKPTGLAYGQVTIRARAVGQALQPDGSGAQPIYGDWASLTFTYQQAPSNLASVSSLVLASPTTAGGSLATDATVSGQLAKLGDISPTAVAFLTVEFDTNADGVPDASAQSDGEGNFTFTPSGLAYGTVALAARVRQHDYVTGGFDYSAWTTLSFTYQAPSDTPPAIASFGLLDDSGSSWADGVTANPAVKGIATSTLFVQLDTNADGLPDAITWPDAAGNFSYTPANLAYGPLTIGARAVDQTFQPDGGVTYVYSAWTSLSFTYQQQDPAAPVFAGLGLIDDTGAITTDTSTAQPLIGGQITFQGAIAGQTVELDTNGDGISDATTTTDQFGDFRIAPVGLTPGAITLYLRTTSSVGNGLRAVPGADAPAAPDGSPPLIGAWTAFAFTYVAPTIASPTITALSLADDTGVSSSDKLTSDATLTGTVGTTPSTDNGQLATDQPVIQFDLNNDGVPDGTTVADTSGNFTWTPANLAPGSVTLRARAVDDDAGGNAISGEWVSLTFTLLAAAPAAATTIGSLALADNAGPSSTALVSTDGAIVGQVAAAGTGASVAGVVVQIDLNADGQPEAAVTTDASGHFAYTPVAGSLPEGVVKIFVRTADQAAAANGATAGTTSGNGSNDGGSSAGAGTVTGNAANDDWTSLSFVLSSDPTSAAVQSQAETLSANLAAAAQAAVNEQTSIDGSQGTFDAARAAAAATYNTTLAAADVAQRAAASTASAHYNTALAAAQGAYGSALGQTTVYSFTIAGAMVAAPADFSVSDRAYVIPGDAAAGDVASGDNFGGTTLGTPVDKTFTITNSTSSDVGVSGLSLPVGFSLVGGFPSVVPAGAAATFTVAFDADIAGGAAGMLSFDDTAAGGGYSFAIAAAIAPPSAVSVSDDGYFVPGDATSGDDFGATTQGAPVEKTFTITNTGSSDAALGGLSLPVGFSLVGVFPTDVPAGGTATFAVALDAAAIGTASGPLSFTVPGAAGALNNGLAAFQGNTASYAYQPYAWPDAPPPPPGPSETPIAPPVEPPTFDGAAFDPEQDPAYAATLAGDRQIYDTKVELANDGYQTDVSGAADTRSDSLNLARQTEQQGFALADQNYETAMAVPDPSGVAAAAAKQISDIQTATDNFNLVLVSANSTWMSDMDKAYTAYVGKVAPAFPTHSANYDTADMQLSSDLAGISFPHDLPDAAVPAAYAAYLKQVADAYHKRDVSDAGYDLDLAKTIDGAAMTYEQASDAAWATRYNSLAGAYQTEQKADDAAEIPYRTAVAESRRWTLAQRADADRDRQEGYDLAKAGYAKAEAQSTHVYNDALALATDTRDNGIADALTTEQVDDAQALVQAGLDLAASVGGALAAAGAGGAGADAALWANYQSGLAGDQGQYDLDTANAQNLMAHTENDAAYADATAVDEADDTRDEAVAFDRQTEQDAEAVGQATYVDGAAANEKDREVKDAGVWQKRHDDQATDDLGFNTAVIKAVTKRGDDDATVAQIHSDAQAGILDDNVADANTAGLDATLAAADLTFVKALAVHNGTYWNSQTDANVVRAKLEASQLDTYAQGLAGDLQGWSKQNDTLEGADEITVGTALAAQDKLDTAARDTADATAANQAAIEVGKDAVAEQGYNDADAGDQETQDVDDAEAQQTLEDSESDNYAGAMSAWATSVGAPNPSAAEQAARAVADDTWTHSVTAAEVADMLGVDAAQVTWATTVDAAAQVQRSDDATAIAVAIVAGDNADAQRATDADLAWTTEVEDLAGAITTYDQKVADVSAAQAVADAKSAHTYHDSADAANAGWTYAWIAASTDVSINANASTYSTAMAAANATRVQALANTAVAWAGTSAGDTQTYVQGMADIKRDWVAGATNAEAGYVSGAATAAATETKTDALAVAAEQTAEANDESNLEISIAQANTVWISGEGTADEGLTHGQAEADATDEVAYAQADADYQEATETNWANSWSQAASSSPSPLASYYASVAQAEAQEIGVDETHVVAEVGTVTQANVSLTDDIESDSVTAANTTAGAIEFETSTFAPQQAQAAAQSATNVADTTAKDAFAQAALQSSAAGAAAKFYQDKAAASRGYDYAVAAADVALVNTLAPKYANWYVQLNTGVPITENLQADGAAASATLNTSLKTARNTETSGYGDAEITEATTLGAAEVTLATAAGADEVELQDEQAAVANTLAAQGALADETLVGTVSQATAGQAAGIAGDVAEWTETAGDAEKESVSGLGDDEVDLARKLAGAEADYAIADAQSQAAIAASFAQGATGGYGAFEALYAQGYVQWLTDLKSSFVANATAVAQDDADHREGLSAAAATLANGRAGAEVDFVSASGATSAELSSSTATADDGYQTSLADNTGAEASGVAGADKVQDVSLAKADAAYILACAQADKDSAVNEANGVANWQTIYKTAIADAKLTLERSRADADLIWIQGVALADKDFLDDDATDWQTMIGGDAQAADQFSREDDATTQIEQDALAVAEAGEMTSEAMAEQSQTSDDAAAAGSFRIARDNETATVWSWLAGQLGTPWAQSQAGLAAAQASWSATAATDYQTYVAALGTDAVDYATNNSKQFVIEMKAIDLADRTDSDKMADAGQTLANAVAGDEAALEHVLAGAGMSYQDDMGQADHDYRYAVAQAVHDLTVSGDAAAYATAMAQAEQDRAGSQDQAVSNFETLVTPAAAQQTTDDANAVLAQAGSQADAELDDAQKGDLAVDGYGDVEAALFAGRQKADAQALRDDQVSDAETRAAAIAAFAQANPTPWASLAAADAVAEAAQEVADANAALAQANSAADAQKTAEQAEVDAEQARDDAEAQAQHDQSVNNAQAVHDEQVGGAVDAVFALLVGLLNPPDDGTAPTLAPDFNWGYKANDFSVGQTPGNFEQVATEFSVGSDLLAPALLVSPSDLSFVPTAPDWGGYVTGAMPWGRVGTTIGSWTPTANDFVGGEIRSAGGGSAFGNPVAFGLRGLVRALPLPQVFQTAMHFTGAAAAGLLLAATSGDRSDEPWYQRLFTMKWHSQPRQTPSNSGAAFGPPSKQFVDPTNQTLNKIDERGAMIAKSGLVLGNQDIKNDIKFGTFKTAIYEGIADALEEQIWNLATAGVLGDAEAELIGIAAKRSLSFSRNVIDITVNQVTARLNKADVAKVQKFLKGRGLPHSIDDAVEVIQGFAFKQLKQATGEIIEKMCFAPETLVATEHGPRRIADIQAGESIYAYDFAAGEWSLAEVLKRHDNMYSGWIYTVVVGDSRIRVTINHPFWVVEGTDLPARTVPQDLKKGENEGHSLTGRWVNSQELAPGDVLIGRGGQRLSVGSVESQVEASFAVCNLTVRGQHTFAVGDDGLLVHNTAWCDTLKQFLAKPQQLVDKAKALGFDASRVHAHHIVMRNAQKHFDQKTIDKLNESKRILQQAGIELFDGSTALPGVKSADDFASKANAGNIQNFAWAINNYDGIHQENYVKAVYERLKEVDGKGKAAVENALQEMREELQAGKNFWDR
jgi:hypothetical protein